jgi:hypothetical protein
MTARGLTQVVAVAMAGLLATGCATGRTDQAAVPEPTVLEVREFQTRTYETKDTKMVMKAVMNALQDENFVVKQANADLGLLTATREMDAQAPDVPKKDAGWAAAAIGVAAVVGIVAVIWAVSKSSSKDEKHHASHTTPAPVSTTGPSTAEKRFEKIFVTECTANVSAFGPESKVRISFERRIVDNQGAVMKAEPVRDAAYYQDFFAKMDKSIFIEKEQV